MKIFISGGSGFVGGAAIRHLSQHHAIAAMARSEKSADIVTSLGAQAINCSLDTVAAEHLADCDIVIHAAAKVEAWGQWSDFERLNIEGTQRMLDAARVAGVRRFIHIGTEAALFHGQPMRDIDESYPLAPDSPFPYSASKAQAEQRVRAANNPVEMTTIILRPRMIWGPGDQTIIKAVGAAVASGQFAWINGGQVKTSTCHIDNLMHAIALAMKQGQGGEAYFITDDEVWLLRDFLSRYLATAGISMPDKNIPAWVVKSLAAALDKIWRLLRLKGTPAVTPFEAAILAEDCILRIDKARQELGYAPVVSVAKGLSDLADDRTDHTV